MDADWDLAASPESSKGGALRGYGKTGTGVVEDSECLDGRSIIGASFDRERSLACGGTENEYWKSFAKELGAFEALKAGGGENDSLALALGELAQAGVYVAAKLEIMQIATH
jgi:hypothetical protein